MRTLTQAEKAPFTIGHIRLVETRDGVTWSELLKRAGSDHELEMAAIVDGLDVSEPLEEGMLVKIVKREAYP